MGRHSPWAVLLGLCYITVAVSQPGAGDSTAAAAAVTVGNPDQQLVTSTPDRCLGDIQRQLKNMFGPYLGKEGVKIALMDVAIGTNLGDNVLWLGARRLIHRYGRVPDILCANSKLQNHSFPFCPEPAALLNATVGGPLLVLWQAGGNWGELWGKVHMKRMLYIQELDKLAGEQQRQVTVIQLPQSIYYLENSLVAQQDKLIIDGLKHIEFVLLTRSLGSHEVAQAQLGTNGVAAFERVAPDIAFMCGHQEALHEPISDIILLIRNDKESVLSNRGMDKLRAFWKDRNNWGVTIKHTDWNYALPTWVRKHNTTFLPTNDQYADLADIRMQAAVDILNKGHVVVANRLHAVIISHLMHKPHFWFEGRAAKGYGKIEQTMGYAYSVSKHCTEDVMQSFGSHADTEEEAFMQALTRAVAYVRDMKSKGLIRSGP